MYSTRNTLLGPIVVVLISASFSCLAAPAPAQSVLEKNIENFANCSDTREPAEAYASEEAWFSRFWRQPQPKSVRNCDDLLAKNWPSDFSSTEELGERIRLTSPGPTSPAPNSTASPHSTPVAHSEKLVAENVVVEPAIAPAREATLAILSGPNACSAWLMQADPQIVETFQSLAYYIENRGPGYVLRERADIGGGWIDHGPYIARAVQNNGRGATITINANGAFFHRKGDIYKADWPGSLPVRTTTWRIIHVGPYEGGTLRAQIIVLLHEFAHVVGAIPEDDPARFGLGRTQANTELVLRHCKQDVDLQGKTPKPILGAALVN
jgi:hypothetical protein